MTPAGRPAPARWWRPLPDGRLACFLCPRRCRLRDGQRAFCFVRRRRGEEIVLDTYGRSTGFCVDPVEKKPLYHFLPGTPVLSFGTAGCNLGCRFCQNWTISRSRDTAALSEEASPATIAAAAAGLGCAAVAFTYNDPVVFAEYAIDTARACRAAGVATIGVTAGYVSTAARAEFFSAFDAVNVDLKAFQDRFYRRQALSGRGGLAEVLDSLRWLRRRGGCWLELTTLLIPGLNDTTTEIAALVDWVAGELGPETPLHFTAFHPDWKLRDRPPTPAAILRRARALARERGLRHVYTGNIHDPEGQSTFCAGCGCVLIEREGFRLLSWRLGPDGACPDCGKKLAGRFASRPGTWGGRRLPVDLAAFRTGRRPG
ncbi:MAG: AmmeMemoRadiSam system radical SAM enzyme [Planctomycetota bacterium]|nr:MAG: AmmeMemoRadiSam system radical SAM enzyme [Planctomycetota bacterium]